MRETTLLVLVLLTLPAALATVTDPAQDDAKSGGDAGDGPETATPLPKEAAGSIGGHHFGAVVLFDDPADWYRFEMTGHGRLAVELRTGKTCAPGLDLTRTTLTLHGPLGDPVAHSSREGCGPLEPLFVEHAAPGTWRISIEVEPMPALGGAPLPGLRTTSEDSVLLEYRLAMDCQPWC